MKIFTLILIFSGLTGLNRCSSDIKIEFPFFQDKNESKFEKVINENQSFKYLGKEKTDTLISRTFIPNYYNNFYFRNEYIINKSKNCI